MSQELERQSAPNEAEKKSFNPGEVAFIKADSEFLTYYLKDLGPTLNLGELRCVAMRDSTVLIGFRVDHSKALIRGRHHSLQAAFDQLS